MRFFHGLLMALFVLLSFGPVPAAAQSPFSYGGQLNVPARLQAESDTPAAGKPVTLAIIMSPRPTWHGYWENPGDAGLGMTVKWDLPAGVTAGPLQYPVPETLLISGLMNYVYEGEYAQLVTLNLPASLKPGDALPIRLRADWLACTDQVCVPEGDDLSLTLTVGDGSVTPARRTLFDGFRGRLPRPLGGEGVFAASGNILRIAVPFPAGSAVKDPYFFPLTKDALAYAVPQSISRNGDWLVIETQKAGDALPAQLTGVLRIGEHMGLKLDARPGLVPVAGAPLTDGGLAKSSDDVWVTILIALGGALLGGLILNIMPCVFPILSLKALSLAKAGGNEGAARRDALAYALGAVATCMALGGALLALRAGGAEIGWAFQLQDPRIILLLLVLVMAIALNLAGLFEFGNLSFGNRLTTQGGTAGSFWTGALAAFVATPCSAPFMGAALGAALVLPVPAALAVFAGLGLGLASPFVALAYIPALRTKLPRPGAWMDRLRNFLSIPMFLTALALVWLLGQQSGTNGMTIGLIAVFAGAMIFWWLGTRQRAGAGTHIVLPVVAVLGVIIAAVALLPAGGAGQAAADKAASGNAEPFSEARLSALRAENRPVFLYFTADWCITCKANEAAAINRQETADAFVRQNMAVMIGDWTNADPAISRFLEANGRSGVPLYLYYAPGAAEPKILPQILTPALLASLAG